MRLLPRGSPSPSAIKLNFAEAISVAVISVTLAIMISILATRKERLSARPEVKSGGSCSWEGKDVTQS